MNALGVHARRQNVKTITIRGGIEATIVIKIMYVYDKRQHFALLRWC